MDAITALASALKAAKNKYPDQRLAQIIVNALPPKLNNDPFYLTDLELTQLIWEYVAKAGK